MYIVINIHHISISVAFSLGAMVHEAQISQIVIVIISWFDVANVLNSKLD